MNVYLVGPSAGYLDGNRKEFAKVAGTLRKGGCKSVTTQLDCPKASPLLFADAIVVMAGWKSDPHARLIVAMAGYADMPIYDVAGQPIPPGDVPDLRSE